MFRHYCHCFTGVRVRTILYRLLDNHHIIIKTNISHIRLIYVYMNNLVFATSPAQSERRNLYLRHFAEDSRVHSGNYTHTHIHTHSFIHSRLRFLSPRAFITSHHRAIIVSMNKLKRKPPPPRIIAPRDKTCRWYIIL